MVVEFRRVILMVTKLFELTWIDHDWSILMCDNDMNWPKSSKSKDTLDDFATWISAAKASLGLILSQSSGLLRDISPSKDPEEEAEPNDHGFSRCRILPIGTFQWSRLSTWWSLVGIMNGYRMILICIRSFQCFHYHYHHSVPNHLYSFFGKRYWISKSSTNQPPPLHHDAPPCHASSSRHLVRKPRTSRPSDGPVASAPGFGADFGAGNGDRLTLLGPLCLGGLLCGDRVTPSRMLSSSYMFGHCWVKWISSRAVAE